VTPTRAEIERLLAEHTFQDQRVELPYGLVTSGEDRRPTAIIVMPESLAGRSVLDVGCHVGFFCFEAERRGATRVLGTEIKSERLEQAKVLKSVLESRADFEHRDVLTEPADEQFDLVLALNVIHHVTDPFAAIKALAAVTKWRLALEFPTFDDPKYRQAHQLETPEVYNQQPLVGMAGKRRTKLVFAPAAIEFTVRYLHAEPLFSSVQFAPSPKTGRMIAICEKD